MTLCFYTDTHLGLPRSSNTTPKSSLALQQKLYDQVRMILDTGGKTFVCLGDVFDRFSNPENIILQGMEVVGRTNLVLSGNHDVVNQADKIGSLQLVNEATTSLLGNNRCVFAEFGKPMCACHELEGEVLYSVPHVANQDLFEQSLGMALDGVLKDRREGTKVLLLHCNFCLSEDRATPTTLNLQNEHVEELLQGFQYIILGHEHIPSEHYGGRLVILGNTFPTGLGDISDKRIATLHGGKLEFYPIWYANPGYAEYQHDELPDNTEANFIRVQGEIEPGEFLSLVREVNQMWANSPGLYCVRMEVSTPGVEASEDGQMRQSLSQLPARIESELSSHPDLLALWKRIAGELR